MNIVDLISSQLTGDVIGKLSGLVGSDAAQTRTATNAAVPALLNVFGKLASTNSGADQMARAMGGLDLGMLGNLAGALGGGQAQGIGSLGGNLLGSLLGGGGGGSTLSMLVNLLSSFTRSQPSMMQSLLGYLAPVVLGMIAKQFTGRPDANQVSRFFSDQGSNISRAVPQGLALNNVLSAIGGGGSRPSEPSREYDRDHDRDRGQVTHSTSGTRTTQGTYGTQTHERRSHEPAPSGMPGWLLPLLLLGALGAGLYWWRNREAAREVAREPVREREVVREPARREVVVDERVTRRGDEVVDRTAVIEREGNRLAGIITEDSFRLPEGLGEAADVVGGLSGMFRNMAGVLGGVTDEASARAALPNLRAFAPELEEFGTQTAALPEASRSLVADYIGSNLGTLQKVVDTVLALPGVRGILGPVLTPMVETVSRLGR
jgi:hypothetical protein